ncbi:MAG: hypothetical protein BGO49_12955 [Planctomycetales bacterium 71-10]|nr:MAG: hypothetical protein BGO49_12955 [Planctomycetales bacterium 71-10]
MASTLCPNCGRKLFPVDPGAPMTCDGCSHAFDPTRVRWRAPSPPRRLFGWFLILVAVLTAIRSIPQAMIDFNREGGVASIVGMYLVPYLIFLAGRALSRSRLVEDPAPGGAEATSPTA